MRGVVTYVVMILLLLSAEAFSMEVGGVSLENSFVSQTGVSLGLNGAGIRSKFFMDIYVASLYLQYPSYQSAAVLEKDGERRMVLHFLYKEVDKEKLTDSWHEGFSANLNTQELQQMDAELKEFDEMFNVIRSGEEIILHYIPGQGTAVTVAGVEKGVITGKPFADALFSIWIGAKPVTKKLRSELLSGVK